MASLNSIIYALACFTGVVAEPVMQTVVYRPPYPNVPPITSAVYMDSSVIPSLTEFTICLWFKPSPPNEQSFSGAGDDLYIHHLHLSLDPYDLVWLYYEQSTSEVIFSLTSSYARISVPHTIFFNGNWSHICGAWNMVLGKLGVYYLNTENGHGDYGLHEITNVRTDNPLPVGEVGGSWVIFHEMDAHTGTDPVGALEHPQSSFGEITGFQLFSRYLSMDEVTVTGCGVRADIFDSLYTDLDIFGSGEGYVIEEEAVSFCGDESGRLKVANKSGGGVVFSISRGYKMIGAQPFVMSAPFLSACGQNCLTHSTCVSFNYKQSSEECELYGSTPTSEVTSDPTTTFGNLSNI